MIIHSLLAQSTHLGTLDPNSSIVTAGDLASGKNVSIKLETTISQVIGIITIVGGIAMVTYFVIGALNWITAAGDASKIQKAREEMVQSVSGMVLLVISYALIGLVGNFLGLHILNPGSTFCNIVTPGCATTP